MSPQLTVWYNTKCPVCNTGIDWQRSRLVRAARAGTIEFRDINLEPDALSRFGAGLEDIRRRLHAVDAEGRLHVGADCALPSGKQRQAMRGSAACSIYRAFIRSRALATTALPTCSTRGTGGKATGRKARGQIIPLPPPSLPPARARICRQPIDRPCRSRAAAICRAR